MIIKSNRIKLRCSSDNLGAVKESGNKKFLYLTFDDGPNFGSHAVLDAFKSAGSLQIVPEVLI